MKKIIQNIFERSLFYSTPVMLPLKIFGAIETSYWIVFAPWLLLIVWLIISVALGLMVYKFKS